MKGFDGVHSSSRCSTTAETSVIAHGCDQAPLTCHLGGDEGNRCALTGADRVRPPTLSTPSVPA